MIKLLMANINVFPREDVITMVKQWSISITEMIEHADKSLACSWVAMLVETDKLLDFISYTMKQDDECYEALLALINTFIFHENKTQLVWLSKLYIDVKLQKLVQTKPCFVILHIISNLLALEKESMRITFSDRILSDEILIDYILHELSSENSLNRNEAAICLCNVVTNLSKNVQKRPDHTVLHF